MATSTTQVPQVVEGFLKELLGAKKAVKLYPAGNPLATEWVQRLHRSLDHALREGLPPLLRIEQGRFEWDGGQLPTKDQALESFRFEMETRRVTEIAIDPAVEPWELQHFLDCLNLRHEDVDAAGGLAQMLAQRKVVHVTLRGPLWGDGGGPGAARPGPLPDAQRVPDDAARAAPDDPPHRLAHTGGADGPQRPEPAHAPLR